MKWSGYFALFLGVLFTSLFVSPLDASAQSSLDSAYQTTDKLLLRGCSTPYENSFDVTENWANILLNVPEQDKDVVYMVGNTTYNYNDAQIQDRISAFQQAGAVAISNTRRDQLAGACAGDFVNITYSQNTFDVIFQETSGGRVIAVNYDERFIIRYNATTDKLEVNFEYTSANHISRPQEPSATNPNPAGEGIFNYVTYGANITYPENYSGELIQETVPGRSAEIRPHYSVSISPDGYLQVKYAKNITHNFNGKSTLVLNRSYEDWTTENELDSEEFEPAHKLDYGYYLAQESQHIKIIISHDQNHSDGDWDKTKNEIEQVEFEIFWDGKTHLNFDNLEGCKNDNGETIACNNLTYEGMNPITAAFHKISFGDHGLASILYAPIRFIGELPNAVDNCVPLHINWGGGQTIPCLGDKVGSFVGAAWSTGFTMMMNAIILLAVGFKSFKFFKDLHTPEKDKIEVKEL